MFIQQVLTQIYKFSVIIYLHARKCRHIIENCIFLRAHEQYGYCQSGTSGMLLDDDTAVIGTPGPYTWRGTVFVFSVSDDYLNRDKGLYYGPVTEHESPVDKYSYLGKFFM